MTNPSPEGAFGCVMRAWLAHEAELLGFLQHQLGDPHRAEDVLQEVFLKAMRQGRSFCEVRQPRAWLFQVARTSLIDDVRRQARDGTAGRPNGRPPPPMTLCLSMRSPSASSAISRGSSPATRTCCAAATSTAGGSRTTRIETDSTLAATKARLRRARTRLRTLLIEHCGVRFDGQGAVCCTVPPAPPTD